MDEEGGGGSSHPSLMHRTSTKRTYGTMAASHRVSPSYDFLASRDGDYADERPIWRRRILHSRDEERVEAANAVRYSGDGLDYRRPVMSDSSSTLPQRNDEQVNGSGSGSAQTTVIDLTDEDGTQASQASQASEVAVPPASPSAEFSRAQRLPRFTWNIFDLEDSPDLEASDSDTSRLPGASYLARPPQWARRGRRPHLSGLRRPARPPSPPVAMDEDEVEFVRERPLRNMASRQPTPHIYLPARNVPRSVTPYPTGVMDNVIDLTVEGDDDVVVLDARQRLDNNGDGGPNVAQPAVAAARDYGHLGHLANILREGGANIGGRLMQRLNGFGFDAIDPDARALQQARDHFEYNHLQRQRYTAERREAPRVPVALPRAPRAAGPMPIMMDYQMTGFDLGLAGGNRPPTPKYEPPAAPGPGFTRSPEEDEVVVCPNCGDELAVGEEEMKQEIWVIKTCGHAYCGECAQNRSIKAKGHRKGKGKGPLSNPGSGSAGPAPFSKCVVDDCGKPAAKNSMIRIYLGT